MRQRDYKVFSMLYGIIFLVFGLLGLAHYLFDQEYLFGILKVNIASIAMHLLIGVIAFWVYFLHPYFQKIYFQNLGFIFAVLTIFGCISATSIFGFIANCWTQTALHGLFALLSLYIGFRDNKLPKETK